MNIFFIIFILKINLILKRLTSYSNYIKWILKAFIGFNSLLISSETTSTPLSLTYGIGFEETNTHWASSFQENELLSQRYEHIKFLLFQGETLFIRRNVSLSFAGDYGIFGKGEVENIFMNSSQFLMTHGILGDGALTLGYLISMTPDRPSKTFLIPDVGYSGYLLKLKTSTTKFKQVWYGPFLGGSLQVNTRDGFIVSLKYNYHWLTLHHNLALSSLDKVSLKFHHAYGHEADLDVQTYLCQNIKIGASLHYIYYRKSTPTTFSSQREDLSISLKYIYDF